ncbi:MAG: RNB domain-containing ribonuclease, partial [Tepidimonas sp.]|nr:RNB domain-containing ribonuclease [Tepidimonas sp.]
LVFAVLGTDGLQRGERVRVRLGAIDELTLEVTGTVIERLGDTEPVAEVEDTLEGEPDDALAAPLTIAVAVDDGETDAGPQGAAGETPR